VNDSTKLAELAASGAHLISTRPPRLGARFRRAPTIKICANPETYRRMAGDMDVDAGRILEGGASLEEVGGEVVAAVSWRRGARTKSELSAPGIRAHLQDLRTGGRMSPGAADRVAAGQGCLP